MSEQFISMANADQFLNRFYRCNDGVIRRVELEFHPERDDSWATIVCSVRDGDAEARWVNLICRVLGLSEFAFSEGRTSYRVLSDGLIVGWFEGLIFLDFGPYTIEPDSVEEFRRSGCYFAGKSATWEVVPYGDHGHVE